MDNCQVTAVINLHGEGILAYPTIKSAIVAIEKAYQEINIHSELLLVLDNPNEETATLTEHFKNIDFLTCHTIEKKDLGLSRNYGVSVAKGEYVTFLDGDDLWGEDWIWRCYTYDKEVGDKMVVWHPETNIVFGKDHHLFHHTDMESKDFILDYLRINNYWTALSFAKKIIYQETPFSKNNISSGFGFEDWNWNCRTIEQSIIHKIAINTCHFIRKKENDSMLFDTNKNKCLVTPNSLFAIN